MSALAVDREKCNSCGICEAECPPRIIEIPGLDAMPSWVEGAPERCIVCGHCVAVCPRDALGLDTMSPEECAPVDSGLLPTAEQVELFLKSRRSIRVYKEKPVPREVLAKLIDTARYAPSGSNSQPLQWLVIEDAREVRRFAGLVVDWMRVAIKEAPELADLLRFDLIVAEWDRGRDRVMRGAPHAIVAHAHRDDVMAPQSATIALTTLELAAYSRGLGACWAGFFQACATFYPPMQEALRLPEGHASLGAMMIGYPKYKYRRIPLRKEPLITWRQP
jgi:nitroreductase/NAD-dependent dihydropyrimidine dehydrogenase PreA subunit